MARHRHRLRFRINNVSLANQSIDLGANSCKSPDERWKGKANVWHICGWAKDNSCCGLLTHLGQKLFHFPVCDHAPRTAASMQMSGLRTLDTGIRRAPERLPWCDAGALQLGKLRKLISFQDLLLWNSICVAAPFPFPPGQPPAMYDKTSTRGNIFCCCLGRVA